MALSTEQFTETGRSVKPYVRPRRDWLEDIDLDSEDFTQGDSTRVEDVSTQVVTDIEETEIDGVRVKGQGEYLADIAWAIAHSVHIDEAGRHVDMDELDDYVDPLLGMFLGCVNGDPDLVEESERKLLMQSGIELGANTETEQKSRLVVRAEDFWGEKLPDRENYIRRMELMVQHTGIAMEVREGKEGKEDRVVFSGKDPNGQNVSVHVVESKFRQVIENAGEANQEVSLEELVAGVKERMTFDINGKEVDMLVIPNGRFNMANERTKFKVNGGDIFRTTGDLIDMMSKQARNWGTEADWGSLMINLNGENIQIKPENRRFILDLHIDNLLSDLGFSRFEATQSSPIEWLHQKTGITVPGDVTANELAAFLTTIRIDQSNGEVLMARFEASEK